MKTFMLMNRQKCLPHMSARSLDHCSADCSLCACNICTPVERVFSQEGLIMKPHRAKMGDSMLELLMYLRCNDIMVSGEVVPLDYILTHKVA